jgi:glycosyltransferase involved in cell wall biosynthesis
MEIVIPVWSLGAKHGGVRVLCELATGLTRRGHRVRVLCFDDGAEPAFRVEAEIARAGAPPRGRNLIGDLPAQGRMRAALERLSGADVALANLHLTADPVHHARIRARKFYYIQAYEPDFYLGYWARLPYRFMALRSYRYPLRHIANCQTVARQVDGEDADRVPIVPPGIDPGLFHARGRRAPGERLVVGTIGRPQPWKGTRDCFEAVRRVRERGIGLDFRVAFGNIPAGCEDVARTDDSPRDDAELTEWYRGLDILLAGVYWRAAPYPPLEAMACGTAVVSTPNDHLREGENALTAPQQDPAALARALERMIRDRALRARLVAEGIRVAVAHHWDVVVEKMERILTGEIDSPIGGSERRRR